MTDPVRPVKPQGLDTPGLVWQRRAKNYVGYWLCRRDILAKGFPIKTRRMWPPSTEQDAIPSLDDWNSIATSCQSLQAEMLEFAHGPQAGLTSQQMFNDTIKSLVSIYINDEDSPIQALRHHTRKRYLNVLGSITKSVGDAVLSKLTFRDFKRWHESWCKPEKPGKPERFARGHSYMTFIRIIMSFGAQLELPHCDRLHAILSKMEFKSPRRRTKIVTAEQATLIRREAHKQGNPSIALAQAFQFDLMLRQKDVVGEWIPLNEPGISDITAYGEKWVAGLRWEEVKNGVLEHRLSKSLRGRKAIADTDAGKVMTWTLSSYPMVMEELALVPESKRHGPIILAEHTGLPWRSKVYGQYWREFARAVGIPDDVQNRDSRAGGATEAEVAGASVEQIRQAMGHSKPDTTRIYTRGTDAATADVAAIRVQSRAKNGAKTR